MEIRFVVHFYLFTSIFCQSTFDRNDFDWSIRAADDFFAFVNGGWLNRTFIPSSQYQWGGIQEMNYKISIELKKILDDLIENRTSFSSDSIQRKLADFYLAALDQQQIERVALQPLKETLINLQKIDSVDDLLNFILHRYTKTDQGLIFEFDVLTDRRNSSITRPVWKQSGLVLPDRDFYFMNDSKSEEIRSRYIYYIDRLLQLSNSILNLTTDVRDAEAILSLEIELAASHQSKMEVREVDENYHQLTIDQLDRIMPNLHWHRIRQILTIQNETFLVNQPNYYQLLDQLIVNRSLNVWKNKIRFTILHEMSKYLNEDFCRARFEMFDQCIYGRLTREERWSTVITEINKQIGEMLGQLYVQHHFSQYAKERTLKLVHHIMDVYGQRILRNEWMTPMTKQKALIKLSKVTAKIGYPSQWQTYNGVEINRYSYFDSISSIFQYDFQKKISDLNHPANRAEWTRPPQISNAFYNPSFNEIIFPAAILQQPYFTVDGDEAIIYGAAGFAISHELTHGFDDQGRKFNENGDLEPWWTPEDIEHFRARTQLLVDQADQYPVLNTTLNGRLTLGENIADLGGIEIAYEAFSQTKGAKENRMIDGFTAKQRFFLSYARTWRVKMTDARTFFLVKSDPHAPPKLRVNGPLSNMNGFYEAFGVTQGDQLYREPSQRVRIW